MKVVSVGVIVILLIFSIVYYISRLSYEVAIDENGEMLRANSVAKLCLNGIVYYKISSNALAPAYKPNGELIKCEIKNSKDS